MLAPTVPLTPPAARALRWLLADPRLPIGGHAHSGGVEQAVDEQWVVDGPSLADFLGGRLVTSVAVGAELAAAACVRAQTGTGTEDWTLLDAEADARTPSPALRQAARRQGGALLAVGRSIVRSPALDALRAHSEHPHLGVVHGALCAAGGMDPVDAAATFAYSLTAGAASAGLRLLGLDPLSVVRILVDLATVIDQVAEQAGERAHGAHRDLAAGASPLTDLLAEDHLAREERLFAT